MSDATQGKAGELAKDLHKVFADRLRSVVAYGAHVDGQSDAPLTCLALVSSLSVEDLEACASHAGRWHRQGIATPLILPEDEFRRSLDAFPLEYNEIIRAHRDVWGNDPFAQITIAHEDLRRACETQIKSHLVHLREGFIESGGQPTAVGQLVAESAPAFAALLRNVGRLSGVITSDRAEATLQGARAAQLPDGIVADVLALERPSAVPVADPARLFPAYIAAVEALARAVDQWR
jgi:hypothetical protein